MVMGINYNNWFYEFHQYLQGTRDGNTTYNDTNWVDIGKLYQSLIDTHSDLLSNQPYGVVGNDMAFDRLVDLLERSNYSFDDIDRALIDTYEHTLRGSMSQMVVNTHNVLVHYHSTDKEHVYCDRLSHYYVIEVPFAQMHFGERDEFIRQKIEKMHATDVDNYMDLDEFFTDEIVNILDFTIICTANGFICNDCKVAMSERGLRFKINWSHPEDADFIIYKLDEGYVCEATVDVTYIENGLYIPFSTLPDQVLEHVGEKCILNIHDANYTSSDMIAPNFGEVSLRGLSIIHLQPHTLNLLRSHGTTNATIRMYFIKYLHEIPNVYPAMNYYDVMGYQRVKTDDGSNVFTLYGDQVYLQHTDNINDLEVCTPPICIDRPIDLSFTSVTKCMKLKTILMGVRSYVETIVGWFQNPTPSVRTITQQIVIPAENWCSMAYQYYIAYVKCATVTSLIPQSLIQRFSTFANAMRALQNVDDVSDVEPYREIDDFYEYESFVNDLCSPFTESRFVYFNDLDQLAHDYYYDNTTNRFNRPVSEQSFITLRYDRDYLCWVFDDPKIQHFHGIGNTFYIDESLNGDEVFKFFVLYSDTKATSTLEVNDAYDINTVIDFDLFSQEVNRHLGFIRYWNIENKLMKLAYLTTNSYSEEVTVEVLSKIMKRKLEGYDILDNYGSDMIYTEPTKTSLGESTSTDIKAPFAINYLFYTLLMLQNNEDTLQAYFYQKLTNDKFKNRYIDLDISSILQEHGTYPINTSRVSKSPNRLDMTSSMCQDGSIHLYYGLPMVFRNTTSTTPSNAYRYTFHVYDNDTKYACVTNENVFDDQYYIQFTDVNSCGYMSHDFTTDAMVARYLTFYLSSLRDDIATIETNYTTTFNQTQLLYNGIIKLNQHINQLSSYVRGKAFIHEDTMSIVQSVITDNPFMQLFKDMKAAIYKCLRSACLYGRYKNVYDNVNEYLSQLQKAYQETGMDQMSLKRIRKLYVDMKSINQPMSLYQYQQWWDRIDEGYIIDEVWAAIFNDNANVQLEIMFEKYGESFIDAKHTDIIPAIQSLFQLYDDLETLKTTHLLPIEQYCAEIMNEYIFDMFVIDQISFTSPSTSTEPAYVVLEIPNDVHTKIPGTSGSGTVSLFFIPSITKNGSNYQIMDLRPIAEYAFFDGTGLTMTSITATAYASNGNTITTFNVSEITFKKVSSSSDTTSIIQEIPNLYNTKVDIQNEHESFTVENNNKIVNTKSGVMNYEMLYGNRFTTLEHVPEMVLQPKNQLQGPIDRIYISNHTINRLMLEDYGKRNSQRMYFKPSQVLHLPIGVMECITGAGGKNFVNQRVYLSTSDTKYTFPATITCVDHSQSKAMLEAVVDENSKWLEITKPSYITKYLTQDITCKVLPDNIGNFLDEFSNTSYGVSYHPWIDVDISDDVYADRYALPGDPIFVISNAPYVYTRLNYFFHESVPNRFIDEEHKSYRFMYMGYRDTRFNQETSNDEIHIAIQCLKTKHHRLSDPELYPILREEPNDHGVYTAEKDTFQKLFDESKAAISQYNSLLYQYWAKLEHATTQYDKQHWQNEINTVQIKLQMAYANTERYNTWWNQSEPPSTWYNVYSYDAANVYMDNGRSKIQQSYIEDLWDIPWFEGLHVYLYDWEDHVWIDPSLYTFDRTSYDGENIDYLSTTDNPDDFTTSDVLKFLTIYPKQGFPKSKRILIYFAYETCDFVNPDRLSASSTCDVRFKPILSLNHDACDNDPYAKLYVRKHFDVQEDYVFTEYSEDVKNFGISRVYHVNRINRSGKYVNAPCVRMCDINVVNGNTSQPFDLYIKMPYPNTANHQTFKIPSYTVMQYQPMDDFIPNQKIKFICIQNRSNVSFNGVISNIMFEGITGDTINDPITITTSTLEPNVVGTFVCCIPLDPMYSCKGGIYTITIDTSTSNVINGQWIKIPPSISMYKEIPDEFLIVPRTELTGKTTIQLRATYTKNSDDTMHVDNQDFNPYEYYFNQTEQIRYPISDVRTNTHDRRLVIPTSNDIKLIKTNYIGICRYALANIPKDGFIDVTGYIPTPLSRHRYEWWVNGRYIHDPSDIIILSPTTFQLRNLKSLHNLELIELVDDMVDNTLVKHGPVYVALDGSVYTSYETAMLCNVDIMENRIQYTFYGFPNHTKLQDYVGDMVSKPNNRDIEPNILESLSLPTTDYRETWNVPLINGVPIYHVTTDQMGFQEIPNDKVLHAFDIAWKREILTNPNFPMTHRDASMVNDSIYQIHVHPSNDEDGMPNVDTSGMFVIYLSGVDATYQTLYISTSENAVISNTTHTQKIIPFVKPGTRIYIDQKYRGMWIHSTDDRYEPIVIK